MTNVAAERTTTTLDWPDIADITDGLATRVREDGLPDVVVGIVRGGLVPAVVLTHALGLRVLRTIEVLHTTSDGLWSAKTPAPTVHNPAALGDLTGRDVLIVDDIAGTGDTMERTVGLVQAAGATRIRTAVCVVNTMNWRRVQPPARALTYLGRVVEGWVVFPWERP